MPISAVTDASVLIGLDKIDLLNRLAPLFDHVLLPPAVAREVAPTVALPDWCLQSVLTQAIPEFIHEEGLGPGETEAIALSLELSRLRLLVDERRARRVAISLGIPVLGTAGLLILAKREEIIEMIRPHLESLIATRFFISERVVEQALRQAGEA